MLNNPHLSEQLPLIQNYLEKYWIKYPHEKENDPTLDEIKSWLTDGGLFFLKGNIFILYQLHEKLAEIVFYWCDMKDISKKALKETLTNHKQFIKSLKVSIYSRAIKDLFKRDYLVTKEKDFWRWI